MTENVSPGTLTRQELYDRIRQSSKDEVILEEMIRLGFWPDEDAPAPAAETIRTRAEAMRELGELQRQNATLGDPERGAEGNAQAPQGRSDGAAAGDQAAQRERATRRGRLHGANAASARCSTSATDVSRGLHSRTTAMPIARRVCLRSPTPRRWPPRWASPSASCASSPSTGRCRRSTTTSASRSRRRPAASGSSRRRCRASSARSTGSWTTSSTRVPLHDAAHGFVPRALDP